MLNLDQTDGALGAFDLAIQLNPVSSKAHVLISKVFVRNRSWDKVRYRADKISELEPGVAFAYLLRGLYYVNANRKEEALRELKTGVGLSFEDAYSYSMVALRYSKLGDMRIPNIVIKKRSNLNPIPSISV